MCEIYTGDLEPFAVYRESTHKARKEYRCTVCRLTIKPGEVYERIFHVSDGEGTTEFACEPCSLIRDGFSDAHNYHTNASQFVYDLRECVAREDDNVEIWRMALADLLKRQRRAYTQREKNARERSPDQPTRQNPPA